MAKILTGIVISVKQKNTAVVKVVRRTAHPLYKKLITRSKKYQVDTTGFKPEIGQAVKISETRPISKRKHFKIIEENKKE